MMGRTGNLHFEGYCSGNFWHKHRDICTYRVLQTIQMKLILLCVWTERAILGGEKNALKLKYEI